MGVPFFVGVISWLNVEYWIADFGVFVCGLFVVSRLAFNRIACILSEQAFYIFNSAER
jgi:hypothetical protein